MRMSIRVFVALTTLLTASSSLFSTGMARSQPKSEYLDKVQRVFGKPAVLAPPVFSVNRDYGLRLRLTNKEQLTRIDVLPKYGFEELVPSWTEPDYTVAMSEGEFNQLLAKLEAIKAIGPLKHRGFADAVTNSKISPIDEYEHGF